MVIHRKRSVDVAQSVSELSNLRIELGFERAEATRIRSEVSNLQETLTSRKSDLADARREQSEVNDLEAN